MKNIAKPVIALRKRKLRKSLFLSKERYVMLMQCQSVEWPSGYNDPHPVVQMTLTPNTNPTPGVMYSDYILVYSDQRGVSHTY